MYCVYILQSEKDRKLYIGYTDNLKRRLKEHRHGLSRATKYRRPLRLVYCEAYADGRDARAREAQLKKFNTAYGELKKRIKHSVEYTD